jgi:hypothetical protein
LVKATHRRSEWVWTNNRAEFCGKGWLGFTHYTTGILLPIKKGPCNLLVCSKCAPAMVEMLLDHLSAAIRELDQVYVASYPYDQFNKGASARIVERLRTRAARKKAFRFVAQVGHPQKACIYAVAEKPLKGHDGVQWAPMAVDEVAVWLGVAMTIPGPVRWPTGDKEWVAANPNHHEDEDDDEPTKWWFFGEAKTKEALIEGWREAAGDYEKEQGEAVTGLGNLKHAEVLSRKLVEKFDKDWIKSRKAKP